MTGARQALKGFLDAKVWPTPEGIDDRRASMKRSSTAWARSGQRPKASMTGAPMKWADAIVLLLRGQRPKASMTGAPGCCRG